MANVVFAAINSYYFVAALQKYTHSRAQLEEARKIALRVLLIKKGGS